MNRPMKTSMLKARIEIAKRLDVDAFRALIKQETGEVVPHDIALASLHKCRCAYAQSGAIDKQLGAQSGEWLTERGMYQGVRWWRLPDGKTNH